MLLFYDKMLFFMIKGKSCNTKIKKIKNKKNISLFQNIKILSLSLYHFSRVTRVN